MCIRDSYNFTGDAPPQPMIPIIAYWDDVDMVPWALPQVYDYMEGWDASSVTSPLQQEVYNLSLIHISSDTAGWKTSAPS